MDQTDFWVDFQEGVNPTEEKGEVQTTATSIITTESVPAVEDLKKSVDGKGEGGLEILRAGNMFGQ